ncbi:hypothetical protein JZ751_000946 [Albula glossodonta]|uniref:AAA+ ATPase domain-containing protein n=1 Tax=Albula glossodonta TaxID=121402 RepID=A0A8T2PX49_9TELE|nr:hypothetical protein JZ751_000946 [Albula glossodonta]
MFSLSTTVQPQVTVHLINAFHSLKSSVATSPAQSHKRDTSPEHNQQNSEVDELVSRLLPYVNQVQTHSDLHGPLPRPHGWRTSHVSSNSFFQNKHGFFGKTAGVLGSPVFCRQSPSPLQAVCADLQYWPVWVQSRGFKTLKSKTRRLQSSYERPVESESYTPSFMKVRQRPRRSPHKGQDSLRRTRLILLILLLLGIYGLSRTPFLSVRFRTTSGLDAAVDPIQMKNVTFEHVKGVEEAKNELQEVVEFLRSPQKFTVLGGKLPKGILLVGPPGTGKTLLARAVAGEADVPFYYASGSEFDEMFVGVGASRIRNLFREAKANAPCVVFIDELDSVGGKRIESPMHPYSRQTINQLLAEMDGFKPNEGVIVIGATNFPEALDNALIRPGRFDMQVTVPRPDVKGRTEILKWYLRKIKVDPAIEPEVIARGTVGFSGAELENLVNQAALKAAVDGKDIVTMKELEFAKDKMLMGEQLTVWPRLPASASRFLI